MIRTIDTYHGFRIAQIKIIFKYAALSFVLSFLFSLLPSPPLPHPLPLKYSKINSDDSLQPNVCMYVCVRVCACVRVG